MTHNDHVDMYLKGTLYTAQSLLELNSAVDDYNLILSDLDHFLELEELTDSEIAHITIRRKTTLIERRRAKDFARLIDQILPKQVEGRTTQDRYEHAIRTMESRVYTPRKITLEEAKEQI